MLKRRLHTSQIIHASTDRVWDVLSNLPAYPRWNPFLRVAQGTLAPGEKVALTMWIKGKGLQRYQVRLTDVLPLQRLGWLGHFHVRGLIDGDHAFVLQAREDGSTSVVHTETFAGLLVPFVWRSFLLRHLKPSFEDLDRNLKAVCEGKALPVELKG